MEAQALQARLLDLNSIMPGALRKLDSSRMAAAAVRTVRPISPTAWICSVTIWCMHAAPRCIHLVEIAAGYAAVRTVLQSRFLKA